VTEAISGYHVPVGGGEQMFQNVVAYEPASASQKHTFHGHILSLAIHLCKRPAVRRTR
jgi:hypothetical protein